MHRRITILSAALAIVLLPVAASAASFSAQRNGFVESGKTITGSFFAAGGTYDLSGTFSDDVYVGGGTVNISGPVGGDVLVAGGTVKINSDVKGGVRVLGGTVEVDKKVGRNLVLLGGSLTTGTEADISGDTVVVGGSASLNGHFRKGIDAWTGSVVLNAVVDGNATLRTTGKHEKTVEMTVTLGPNTVVNGDLTYSAVKDADIRAGAKITGKTVKETPVSVGQDINRYVKRAITLGQLWILFSLLVVSVLVCLLFPKTVRKIRDTMLQRTGASVGWGTLLLFASPIAFILLPFTVIGIPLMVILVALYLLALYVSQVFMGFTIGDWILGRLRKPAMQPQPSVPSSRSILWPAMIGVIVVSLVMDFLLGSVWMPNFTLLNVIVFIARLFLIVWPFGALVLVSIRTIRERELQ